METRLVQSPEFHVFNRNSSRVAPHGMHIRIKVGNEVGVCTTWNETSLIHRNPWSFSGDIPASELARGLRSYLTKQLGQLFSETRSGFWRALTYPAASVTSSNLGRSHAWWPRGKNMLQSQGRFVAKRDKAASLSNQRMTNKDLKWYSGILCYVQKICWYLLIMTPVSRTNHEDMASSKTSLRIFTGLSGLCGTATLWSFSTDFPGLFHVECCPIWTPKLMKERYSKKDFLDWSSHIFWPEKNPGKVKFVEDRCENCPRSVTWCPLTHSPTWFTCFSFWLTNAFCCFSCGCRGYQGPKYEGCIRHVALLQRCYTHRIKGLHNCGQAQLK